MRENNTRSTPKASSLPWLVLNMEKKDFWMGLDLIQGESLRKYVVTVVIATVRKILTRTT